MSLHYILDGYNIVKQIPQLSLKELKAARQGLYSFIETYRPQGSPRNKITVVFDGRADIVSRVESSSVEAVFSKGSSADEEIKAMVARAANPATTVVVSDDRQLKLEARSLGARIMPVSDFLEKCRGKGQKIQEDKNISFGTEHKINAELRKIWLKK